MAALTSDKLSNVTSVYDDVQNLTARKVNPKTRQYNCAMNPQKQLDKLVKDAKLPTFNLEVKNIGFNLNIKCNSGSTT